MVLGGAEEGDKDDGVRDERPSPALSSQIVLLWLLKCNLAFRPADKLFFSCTSDEDDGNAVEEEDDGAEIEEAGEEEEEEEEEESSFL